MCVRVRVESESFLVSYIFIFRCDECMVWVNFDGFRWGSIVWRMIEVTRCCSVPVFDYLMKVTCFLESHWKSGFLLSVYSKRIIKHHQPSRAIQVLYTCWSIMAPKYQQGNINQQSVKKMLVDVTYAKKKQILSYIDVTIGEKNRFLNTSPFVHSRIQIRYSLFLHIHFSLPMSL